MVPLRFVAVALVLLGQCCQCERISPVNEAAKFRNLVISDLADYPFVVDEKTGKARTRPYTEEEIVCPPCFWYPPDSKGNQIMRWRVWV